MRALRRDAVFFLITPRFAALSIALNAALNCSAALVLSVFEIFSTFLIMSRMFFLRESLVFFFLIDPRRAFFADVVIGMGSKWLVVSR